MKILKKKIILLLLFLIQFTFAQKQDSISTLLNSYIPSDTLRSRQLIKASNYFTYSNPQRALKYINEGLTIAKKKNWKNGTALALNQKGSIYYTMADNLKALDNFLEALSMAEQVNNQKLTLNLYNNIANIYADMKDFDKALDNYNKCLNISAQQKDSINQIRAFNNIGNVYSETHQVDKSLTYFDKALFLAQELNNTFFVAAIINNKGLAYKRKEDYKNSLKYYSEALRLSQNINNKYIEATALNSLGKVYVLQNEFNQAKKYAEKALIVSKNIDAVEWQADSWQVLNQAYENDKNYERSLFAYKQYIKLRDSVTSQEKNADLTKKDMQYQLDKQDALASAEIRRQSLIKNTAIGIGGFLLLFAVVGYLLYKRKRDADQLKNTAEIKAKMAETELKALRSQMNPHFIFNSLNSISNYLQTNNTVKADEYLAKFSRLTRSILENSEKKWIPLREDLELLKLYIEIESLRLKNKLSYHIKIDENMDIDNTLIPPLILQPFIENSIWHGISKKENDGTILIEISSANQNLICAVEDNGLGRNGTIKNPNKNNNSMGIKITNQRLDIINEIKNVKGTINFIDKKQGLRVEISLPLELKF
ncbi:tetratricopeptide repeat protein [Hwangdonia seohaensis]|uniref:Tetratricopeptide repeat protein n=1 Tax=Hwangdonia seohaensis TaxID=1240727 RepID=A0ABW3RBT2_9FLAO|nr:tetratricopeptide repeat protein [Hwangdonia seohaensis]